MFGKIRKGLRGDGDDEKQEENVEAPYVFDSDTYNYPSLYEEADEMLQVALLIYTMTDLRALAKKKKTTLINPELVLTLPLRLGTCLRMIEDNLDLIKQYFGDEDHALTMAALQSIQDRYDKHSIQSSGSNNSTHWLNPFASGAVEGVEVDMQPSLIWFGDERPDKDLVYAVGVDPIRKRVTVAFRGSVTSSDFLADASITLNRQENIVFPDQGKIGIHNGFYDYLLKERKGGENKFQEIMKHVSELFEDSERQETFRLYVTGHSLGGALATLFSFYAAASDDYSIPKPVTCVSVASPRVGEGLFQRAFMSLEEQGKLRHLRIANDGDPVTLMPTSSSKKLWAMLSPISYVAFKISDREFEEKETYKHTGIKLKLKKSKDGERSCEIAYSGAAKEERVDVYADSKSKSRLSFRQKDLPEVSNHFGNVYCDNLEGVKDKIAGLSLNQLYLTKAAAASSTGDNTESP
jgi:hypothetical protein